MDHTMTCNYCQTVVDEDEAVSCAECGVSGCTFCFSFSTETVEYLCPDCEEDLK